MAIRDTNLDTQNLVVQIAVTSSADGTVAVYVEGDFDSAAVEIGRKDAAGAFQPFTNGSLSAAEDIAIDCGRDMEIFARALGASPDVDIQTTVID